MILKKRTKRSYLGVAGRALLRALVEFITFDMSLRSSLSFAARRGITIGEAEEILKKIDDRRRYAFLKKKKIIKEQKLGDRTVITLTNLGTQLAIAHNLFSHNARLPKDMVCLVSFDIPEHARNAREAFRKFLKIKGFQLLQKSVWIHSEDVTTEITALIKELKIQEWVSVFLASPKI